MTLLIFYQVHVLPLTRKKVAKHKERIESFPNLGKGMCQMSFLVF